MNDVENIRKQYIDAYICRLTRKNINYCRQYCSSEACNNEYPCLNFELYHRLRFLEDILLGTEQH